MLPMQQSQFGEADPRLPFGGGGTDGTIHEAGPHHEPINGDAGHGRHRGQQVEIDIAECVDERARRGTRQQPSNDCGRSGQKSELGAGEGQVA